MKYSLKATSIIEAIIVLLVVVTGITGVYGLLASSQKLANSTSLRIEAIQIARDGLEGFTNIRDTNWIRYSADYENCWNVLNYNSSCIGNPGRVTDIQYTDIVNRAYILYRDNENKYRLQLQNRDGGSYTNSAYRVRYGIRKEPGSGFYTQSGGLVYGNSEYDPFYTREIQIDYKDSNGVSQGPDESNNDTMEVTVIVQWNDTARQEPQRLEMSTLLTNWKAKK